MIGQVDGGLMGNQSGRVRAYRLISVVKFTEAAIMGKGESQGDSLEEQ